ncbi:hypothetical protein MMC25_006547, partial [Agyrium rufum]|nr:hypothetical protein [Agyrium rufum]
RKTRCDPGVPRCGPCERNNQECEYYDAAKKKNISRTYIVYLQNKVHELEQELALVKHHGPDPFLEPESIMRQAGLVKVVEADESRFLGPSSGIAMTRLVMELAKRNVATKNIKDIIPENQAQQIKDRFALESSKPTSKVYPLISSVAAPSLPTLDLTQRLVDTFNSNSQVLLPVLHEPTFAQDVYAVYHGSTDPYKNFVLRMVIAISMQTLDTQFAGLADSYYLAALAHLENAIRPMNIGTLQCFALIAQYSVVTPTRTASYWVVGLATRLCQEMGLTEESTISRAPDGALFGTLELDMRRRLFFIITSMEFGLAHSLGRPSALAVTYDHIDISNFLHVDDSYISQAGVVPNAPISVKKQLATHFFKMRLLQAEIRRQLYLKRRPTPKSDADAWFKQMEEKLVSWHISNPFGEESGEIGGISSIWLKVRYNTVVVLLFRPSPQIPEPSRRAAFLCYDAVIFNIKVQRQQMAIKSVDVTWIFTQELYMALNTLLWTLSYPEIRKAYPKSEVSGYLEMGREAIWLTSERWPGVESALDLYSTLIEACLKGYENDEKKADSADKPQIASVPHTLSDEAGSSPALSNSSTLKSSPGSSRRGLDWDQTGTGVEFTENPASQSWPLVPHKTPESDAASSHSLIYSPQSYGMAHVQTPTAQPIFYAQASLPPLLPPGTSFTTSEYHVAKSSWSPAQQDNLFWGLSDDPYAQFLDTQYLPQEPLQSLDLQQQTELMSALEEDGWKYWQGSAPASAYHGLNYGR